MRYDRSKLHQHCLKYKIESGETEDKIIFFCPTMPDEKIRVELISIAPKEAECIFVVGPKRSTHETLILLLKMAGIDNMTLFKFIDATTKNVAAGNTNLVIKFDQQIEDDNPLWNDIGMVLAKDGFYKTWQITFGDKTVTDLSIKIAEEISENHHIRDNIILDDDMLNLQISLNKEQDVLDFLKEIEDGTVK